MDSPLNYSITPVKGKEKTYKVTARIKRNGEDKRKTKTISGTIRDAHRCGLNLVDEIEEYFEGFSPTCSLTYFSECVQYYRRYKDVHSRNASYINQLEDELGHIEVNILKVHFMLFRDNLMKRYTRGGKKMSNGTINRYTSWANSILNFCANRELIVKNPLGHVPKLKEQPRTRILKDDEVRRLLKAISEHRDYLLPMVEYALIIPTRKSLLIHMERDWVDIENRTIHVPAKFTKHGQHDDIKPIPPRLVSYFEGIPEESKFVFYRIVKGKYVTLGDFKHAWAFCLKKSGIKDFRFHDLRHHAATKLLSQGIPERAVMQVGNWKSNMFNTYYNMAGIDASQQVYDMLKDSKNVPPNMPLL